jgi:hypothetical protein
VLMDSSLHFFDAVLDFCEWHTIKFFSSSCGLRQVDPLSLMLLVLVMEEFGRMIYAAVSGRLLSGFI